MRAVLPPSSLFSSTFFRVSPSSDSSRSRMVWIVVDEGDTDPTAFWSTFLPSCNALHLQLMTV